MITHSTPNIHDLYPGFTDKELAEAEEILEKYLALVLRIYERNECKTYSEANHLTPGIGTLPFTPPEPKSPV